MTKNDNSEKKTPFQSIFAQPTEEEWNNKYKFIAEEYDKKAEALASPVEEVLTGTKLLKLAKETKKSSKI